jgi:hypothetical protein
MILKTSRVVGIVLSWVEKLENRKTCGIFYSPTCDFFLSAANNLSNHFTQIIRSMYTPKFFLSIFILLMDVLSNVQPQNLLNFYKNYPALIQDEVHQLIRVIYCQLLCKAIVLCLE